MSSPPDEKASPHARDLVQLIRQRARTRGSSTAFTFLRHSGEESGHLTYEALDVAARSVAAELQRTMAAGDRALLVYSEGQAEFVIAFCGCLYAGVIPVVVPAQQRNRSSIAIERIAREADTATVLTTNFLAYPALRTGHLANARCIATNTINPRLADDWREPRVSPDDLAFLQYTSGSTTQPRGVMVTHGNVLSSQRSLQRAFGLDRDSIIVCWVPLYHDMGLVGNILHTLYIGARCIVMSPLSVLQEPVRWLKAVTRYRATASGGPNFGYEFCLKRVPAHSRRSLDLSSWAIAYNGGEPIRAETLERFAAHFASAGFRDAAFAPCYGLAEATLLVSGGATDNGVRMLDIDSDALAKGRVVPVPGGRRLVSCGAVDEEQTVVVVDPDTLTAVAPGRVGEVWVTGPNVAAGYWKRQSETLDVFHQRPLDTVRGPYLRTGDIGFLHDGELFVTGRLKDVIIVRGRNHYPQDIERTAERSHRTLRSGCGAAFAVERGSEAEVVVVQEMKLEATAGSIDFDEVAGAIRRNVSQEHQLGVVVRLVPPGSVPKTTSGKVRRSACKAAYLAGSLPSLPAAARGPADGDSPSTPGESHAEWTPEQLRIAIAGILGVCADDVRLDQPLFDLGLDSLEIVRIKSHLEDELGYPLPIGLFLENITLGTLAKRIGRAKSGEATIQTSPRVGRADVDSPYSPGGSPQRSLDFSLLFFASQERESREDSYGLLIDAVRFADEHGFTAVWIPERHFHAFGGLYPSPSVLAAGLATVTRRIRLRAGSVVLPLHHPVRVAEEWSVVDNLSGGRVDVAFATGWNPNDFIFAPHAFADRRAAMLTAMETVLRLWRGETVEFPNGHGEATPVQLAPLPRQRELPVWITCTGAEEMFAEAGSLGANVLTALLFQTVDELAAKISVYRDARYRAGHDPVGGVVTLMVHTFLTDDAKTALAEVRQPFIEYLRTSVSLWRQGAASLGDLTDREGADLLELAFARYSRANALFGSPESVTPVVQAIAAAGVDEIACLIDFGLDADRVLAGLYPLKRLARVYRSDQVGPATGDGGLTAVNTLARTHRQAF